MKFQLKENLINKLDYIQRKNWFITVFIFLIIFVAAVIVWKDCIWKPQPSEVALRNIVEIEEKYDGKMKEIEKNHEILREQIKKFENPQNNLEKEKKYFKPPEIKKNFNSSYSQNQKKYNPSLVN